MKMKILWSLLTLLMITGCTPGTSSADGESQQSTDTGGNEVLDGGSTTFVSQHNQGRACLECHGPGSEDSFDSGGTVFTTINGTQSSEYADQYKIRLLLDNTQNVNYSTARGSGNSYSSDSRLTSSYTYTAQVVDSSGNVVNASALNSHDYTRVDCNRCHTSSGTSGAPGRIVSYNYYAADSGGTTGTTTGATTFVESVMPLLVTYCQGCHGNNGNFRVTTADLTYGNITTNSFVNTANAESSLLLTKAIGTSHGGGMILPVSGTTYQTLRNWIAEGALNNSNGGTGGTTGSGAAMSFSADVMPVLSSSCTACHGNSGNFTVTTTAATYSNITSNGFADTANVTASLLLTKASGTNHGGGTILPASGAGYQTVRDWISQGALNN